MILTKYYRYKKMVTKAMPTCRNELENVEIVDSKSVVRCITIPK
jgi:hypothetical protein